MCWNCGGRCVLCGEPSAYEIQVPELKIYTLCCEEHNDEMNALVDDYLDKINKAALN